MTTSWYDRKSKGLYNVPGVPMVGAFDAAEELVRLQGYKDEFQPAVAGLSAKYTIGGHTASGQDFLVGNPNLGNLSLENPAQFAISWTTVKDVYGIGMRDFQKGFVETLESPEAATAGFWDMIARNGTAYNLLILRCVTDTRGAELKSQFQPYWDERGLDSILKEGRLYEIDLSIFESVQPYRDGKQLRFNPATLTLLERDKTKKGSLRPVLIRAWTATQQPVVYGPQSRGKGTWLYALQAAKTSATLYGIWLGHVYHWHFVTAAMQGTWDDNIPDNGHPLRDLLKQQSAYLMDFDWVILNTYFGHDIFKEIAPPSGVGDPNAMLKLLDSFAKGRQYFDDDPKSELEKNGLKEADFTLEQPWDMYPVARHLVLVWDICEAYVKEVVSTSYADDGHVASDSSLQNWMNQAANTDYGNIRGLPKMDNREALTRVLVSMIFRITMHGVSRLINSANPELTWVANFPSCLQRDDIPPNSVDLQNLLTYLPNTGTIGGMMAFYFGFAFSKPQVPLIPNPANSDLPFGGGLSDPRNVALVKFRQSMAAFISDQYKWWQKGLFPLDIYQWPRNVEL
jgi:hypothetical protein